MIQLTRLNDEPFTLNALYIEQIQAFPDTTITLTNGKKLIVKEEEEEVVKRIILFYQKVGLNAMGVYESKQHREGEEDV